VYQDNDGFEKGKKKTMETREVIRCCECYKDISEYYIVLNNNYYCEECYDETVVQCDNCGCDIQTISEDYFEHEGEIYCESCYDELFVACYDCSTVIRRNDAHNNCNGDPVCQDCFNQNYAVCDSCGSVENASEVYYRDGNCYCESCFDDRYYYCDRCDDYHDRNEACEYEDSIIHKYGYKPEPIFFTVENEKPGLFIGFELEVERGDSYTYVDDMAELINDDFIYFKEDGSLNEGFEIVSHPLSKKWIAKNRERIKYMLQKLSEKGYKSYDTDTCGMHVHLTKKYLNSTEIAKLLKFFKENSEFVFEFSRRRRENFDRWCTTSEKNMCNVIGYAKKKINDGPRHIAANITKNTIEIRIFRGTLKPESFFKNIEFAISLCEYVKETGYNDTSLQSYLNYIDKHKKSYKHLYSYLVEKEYIKRQVEEKQLTN